MTLRIYEDIQQGDAERFRKYVPELPSDQCWEWQSTRNGSGYGKFWLRGRTDLAHRVAFRVCHGPIPPGLMVRHTCDNPPCANPSHLILGTVIDNARDALDRDRYRRGSRNPRAKLTEQAVIEIRQCWTAGETQVSLARRFGVSRAAVQFALSGKNWAHVKEAL